MKTTHSKGRHAHQGSNGMKVHISSYRMRVEGRSILPVGISLSGKRRSRHSMNCSSSRKLDDSVQFRFSSTNSWCICIFSDCYDKLLMKQGFLYKVRLSFNWMHAQRFRHSYHRKKTCLLFGFCYILGKDWTRSCPMCTLSGLNDALTPSTLSK